jgi:hypothetical protein
VLYGTAAVVVPCGVDSGSSVVPITTQELSSYASRKLAANQAGGALAIGEPCAVCLALVVVSMPVGSVAKLNRRSHEDHT